jgi:hypothetical protein
MTQKSPLVRFGAVGRQGPASAETESSALAIARMPLLRDHCAERIGEVAMTARVREPTRPSTPPRPVPPASREPEPARQPEPTRH